MFTGQTKIKTCGEILLLPIDYIYPNPNQPRRDFNMEELHSLADSIRISGILQPITVRRQKDGLFELVAGERRLRAARIAGIPRVPCIEISIKNDESAILALVENIQRENLNYFEEAEGIALLIRQYGMKQNEIARKIGKSQSTLSNKLRLLRLAPFIRCKIKESNLTERHARALLKLENFEQQKKVLEIIIKKNLNVYETDKLIENINKPMKKKIAEPMIIVKDIRIFVNTLDHALYMMKKAGIHTVTEKKETDEVIEYHLKIKKNGKINSQQSINCAG